MWKGIGQWSAGSSVTRHVAAPSLGHYASLSFVARGRGQKIEDRDSPVGAAFSRDSNNFYDLPLNAYYLILC